MGGSLYAFLSLSFMTPFTCMSPTHCICFDIVYMIFAGYLTHTMHVFIPRRCLDENIGEFSIGKHVAENILVANVEDLYNHATDPETMNQHSRFLKKYRIGDAREPWEKSDTMWLAADGTMLDCLVEDNLFPEDVTTWGRYAAYCSNQCAACTDDSDRKIACRLLTAIDPVRMMAAMRCSLYSMFVECDDR